ncbi:hypothetical protein LX81_02960 [Palleronia aestuarii]|uniref:Uncharacterized protein n=1 Tax=Palleronia aestuarii TaxID=568105 RepID=A0A2W7N2B1_9RHOB|nr:hypothetical protein [Palleronia aestuarii]PZX14161.1 hypothetical protein LX81_02960 [Palleronia aestuarii]
MSDRARHTRTHHEIQAQKGRPRPNYSIGEFLAAIAAEPHRLADLLDDNALPSQWEEAQAAAIARRNARRTAAIQPVSTWTSDPCDDSPDPRDARIATLTRWLWCLSLALTAISVAAIIGWVG